MTMKIRATADAYLQKARINDSLPHTELRGSAFQSMKKGDEL
jgi:hypothetical protein